MPKRKCLSLDEKVQILGEVDLGRLKKKDIAAKYKIACSSLSTIVKNRDGISSAFENMKQLDIKTVKSCVYDDVDDAVCQSEDMLQEQRMMVSELGNIVEKEQAPKIGQSLGNKELNASNGCLDRFKKCHGITQKVVCEEISRVSNTFCDSKVSKRSAIFVDINL